MRYIVRLRKNEIGRIGVASDPAPESVRLHSGAVGLLCTEGE